MALTGQKWSSGVLQNGLNNIERMNRVWKGILGIRDLTKIRCGIRENAKYLDGIRDLTATREAGFAKIWARDAGFFGLSAGNSGKRHDPSKRYSGKSESTRRAKKYKSKGPIYILNLLAFAEISLF